MTEMTSIHRPGVPRAAAVGTNSDGTRSARSEAKTAPEPEEHEKV